MTVPQDKPAPTTSPKAEPAAPGAPSQGVTPIASVAGTAVQPARPAPPPGPAAVHAVRAAAPAQQTPPHKPQQPAPAAQPRPVPPPPAMAPPAAVRPTAGPARLMPRHLGLALSFLLAVVIPVVVTAWYLYARAADQYASYMGFTVRTESGPTSSELLGGLSAIVGNGSSSGSDTGILYKFIQSRDLVQRVDARLDLRAIWSKPENDPIFGYTDDDSLEGLLAEWERKVRVYYDEGMIDLRVLAFDPQDAQNIAQAIYDESTVLINQLNDVSRADTLRYSQVELDKAVERLRTARQAMTRFRNEHQLVDPTADVAGQVTVVSTLQAQLAEQLVALGLLQANAPEGDPRIAQSQLRVDVIRDQIAAERQKFGSTTATGAALSEVVGQFEGLAVDREFAEQAYVAALAAHESAQAEATRQSRYLAAYVKPTLAQETEFPKRLTLIGTIGGFLLLVWVVGALTFYSLRDRR